MARIYSAALLAAAFSTSALVAAPALADPVRTLWIAPGQTAHQALLQSRTQAPQGAAHHATRPADSVDPTISSGTVASAELIVGKANSIPTLRFLYQATTNGLNSANFTFTSPNGNDTLNYSYYPRVYATGGTVTFSPDSQAPFFSQPGQWQLTSALILDNQYNYTQYTQAQLAAIFTKPYITVVNKGLVDTTPPVVTAGKILTPTVSLSSSPFPTFRATLTGTDDVSGIAYGLVVIQAPGSSFGQVELVLAPAITKNGTVTSYANFYPGQPTGSWTIIEYELCDLAGNCTSDTSAADITALFGTNSFTVNP